MLVTLLVCKNNNKYGTEKSERRVWVKFICIIWTTAIALLL